MDIQNKAADENVTFADLKESHENLAKEFKSQFSEWQGKVQPYIQKAGDIPSDFKEQLDRLNDRLDELETIKRRALDLYDAKDERDEPDDYHKAYREFVTKGDRASVETFKLLEEKGLATDSDVEGGYMVPTNVRNQIIEKRRAVSPVRNYAQTFTISIGDTLEIPREDDTDFDAGWTGERSSRTETDTAGLEMLKIPTHEIYAKPKATQKMLDDAAFDVEAYLERKVADKFARKEASAFVNGDGQNKPEGILSTSETVTEVNSGASASLTYQGLLDLVYDIEIDEYLRRATMMMNRSTVGKIRGLTDDQNMPIWSPGISESDPPNILGYEYFTATDMPTVAANAKAIVFGDLSIAYVIVDRMGIRFLRDPYSDKPRVEFYYTTRVGGQLVNPDALRFHVIAA